MLVHTALVLIGLMALSTFVVDYGILWASRRQAQNAADAGALAGAVHMLYDTNMVPTADVLDDRERQSRSRTESGQQPPPSRQSLSALRTSGGRRHD